MAEMRKFIDRHPFLSCTIAIWLAFEIVEILIQIPCYLWAEDFPHGIALLGLNAILSVFPGLLIALLSAAGMRGDAERGL
jgi:hypothetical protein